MIEIANRSRVIRNSTDECGDCDDAMEGGGGEDGGGSDDAAVNDGDDFNSAEL